MTVHGSRKLLWEEIKIVRGIEHLVQCFPEKILTRLVYTGGLNAQLFNALQEGGAHNGVLTAVEDFLNQSKIGTLYVERSSAS
ncbi:hypothetical protein KAR10_02780 [bacterium]|nr:hypothetical protein [bacterium]